ncbi:ankyrin repeat domain-containing protein [Luteibacter aegosomaticola]|uniref:ankyrin repeat domain-containing protein n=1 Tax=Luteibacter aegosomaticola TaxID=2911538 RepID=UPI001FF93FC9|nr:ankyrin repeat domain-containing protein [Luteibacter aegosomaticola]UPG90597.1 ankyrin repeat domain-containing protein [Luteibacter aegosomaticola]
MANPKRRRPPLIKALPWFLPALAAVACAGLTASPLALIPLLLANTLAMAAVCHAIGFDPEPNYLRTALRRGSAYVVMFTVYTFVVFVLVAWPLLKLTQAPSLGAALLLAATLVIALGALWRVWPAFGLVYLWDDAYPESSGDGSWIFTAMARSVSFGRHLSAEERFFSHFLPAALGLLVLAFCAVALSGLYGVLPAEMRIAALGLYAVVLLPACSLLIANRTLRALLCDRRGHIRTARADTRREPAISDAHRVPTPEPIPELSTEERQPEIRDGALLAAIRSGDVARAVALVEAGANPNTVAEPGDRDQRPVLTLAALSADTRLLRALIARGADVNRAHQGVTALLAACRDSWHGRPDAVLTLVSNGANAAATDAEGNTALHGAVLSAEPMVAAMLLDAGAPVDAVNAAGETPLAIACRAANWALARFLLEHGAKPAPVGAEPALVAAAGIADDDAEGVRVLLRHKAPVNAANAHGRTALLAAASEGHEQIARVLMQAHANPNLADRHGTTALMEASRAGATGIVQVLADAQADASPRDSHGRDALTLACQSPRAQAATVRALLAMGAQPKATGADGRSALDHATAGGRWDFVALLDPDTPLPTSLSESVLPEAGADSPLHLHDALRFGHWAVASTFASKVREWPVEELAALYVDLAAPGCDAARAWLFDHGLSAEARLAPPADDESDAQGRRLFDALLPQLPQSADALLQLMHAGASPAGAGLLGQAICRLDGEEERLTLAMLDAGADPFGADARGRTPVHMAAATGAIRLLTALLARGLDPNVRDAGGRTPLHAALEHGGDALPLVRLLVAHGADPEAADVNGETPYGLGIGHGDVERWLNWHLWPLPGRSLRASDLPAAAAAGDMQAVDRLLELGFDIDTRDAQGATALLRAAGAGQADVATHLLDAGADPATAAASGVTPLAAAVNARRDAVVERLLARGVAVDQRLPGDTTALMIAAALGYPDIVERLLAAGADTNAEDAHGHTALHAAAQYCFGSNDSLRARRLLDLLIGRAADVNKTDKDGATPLLLLLGSHMRPGTPADATHLGALVPVLLDAGAKIEHADQRGVSALHACAMHALLPPARVLLHRGANRNAADAFGRTAGDVARHLGYVDIAHELGVRANAIPSVRQTLRQPAQPE